MFASFTLCLIFLPQAFQKLYGKPLEWLKFQVKDFHELGEIQHYQYWEAEIFSISHHIHNQLQLTLSIMIKS